MAVDFADLQARVHAYFDGEDPREPPGRLILDLWKAVRALQTEIKRHTQPNTGTTS